VGSADLALHGRGHHERRGKSGLRDPTVEKLGSKTYQVTADINSLSADSQTALINKVANSLARPPGSVPTKYPSPACPTWEVRSRIAR